MDEWVLRGVRWWGIAQLLCTKDDTAHWASCDSLVRVGGVIETEQAREIDRHDVGTVCVVRGGCMSGSYEDEEHHSITTHLDEAEAEAEAGAGAGAATGSGCVCGRGTMMTASQLTAPPCFHTPRSHNKQQTFGLRGGAAKGSLGRAACNTDASPPSLPSLSLPPPPPNRLRPPLLLLLPPPPPPPLGPPNREARFPLRADPPPPPLPPPPPKLTKGCYACW